MPALPLFLQGLVFPLSLFLETGNPFSRVIFSFQVLVDFSLLEEIKVRKLPLLVPVGKPQAQQIKTRGPVVRNSNVHLASLHSF